METKEEECVVEITTDGSSLTNPGPGGWAVIFKVPGHTKALFGFSPHTTNNRMELTAAIKALEHLKRPCTVNISIDSEYVLKGITVWIKTWKQNGWKASKWNATRREYARVSEVVNRDLWEALDRAVQRHQVTWIKVRGHANHEENIQCDLIAREAARRQIEGIRTLEARMLASKHVQIPLDLDRAITFE